jgi:hypothetical protein
VFGTLMPPTPESGLFSDENIKLSFLLMLIVLLLFAMTILVLVIIIIVRICSAHGRGLIHRGAKSLICEDRTKHCRSVDDVNSILPMSPEKQKHQQQVLSRTLATQQETMVVSTCADTTQVKLAAETQHSSLPMTSSGNHGNRCSATNVSRFDRNESLYPLLSPSSSIQSA